MSASSWLVRASTAAALLCGLSATLASPASAAKVCDYITPTGSCIKYGDSGQSGWPNWGPWANMGQYPRANPWEFDFGFGVVSSWLKTHQVSYGPGIGAPVDFFNDSSTTSFFLSAGAYTHVAPSVSVGPVVNLITGPTSVPQVAHVSSTGVSGLSQVSQTDLAVDIMARAIFDVPVPNLFEIALFAELGVDFETINATLNNQVEIFSRDKHATSLVVGGGAWTPLCWLVDPSKAKDCPIHSTTEFTYVAKHVSIQTGVTPGSSAIGFVNGEYRWMSGLSFETAASDIRLKRDVVAVGRLDNGLGLYRYRYLWSDQDYVGVMAQEVALIMPDAVIRGSDGYLRVNYARLGLKLQTWDEWRASHSEAQVAN